MSSPEAVVLLAWQLLLVALGWSLCWSGLMIWVFMSLTTKRLLSFWGNVVSSRAWMQKVLARVIFQDLIRKITNTSVLTVLRSCPGPVLSWIPKGVLTIQMALLIMEVRMKPAGVTVCFSCLVSFWKANSWQIFSLWLGRSTSFDSFSFN